MSLNIVYLAIALFLLAQMRSHGQEISAKDSSFTCGLNATYIFLNKTQHHATYTSLLHDFENQHPSDSLLAIHNVLEKHGCETIGIKTDADYFLNKSGPAIVYLQLTGYAPQAENHFSFFVKGSRQIGAELLDPVFDAQTPSIMTWDTFSRIYQGVALILK
jgi:ABC-type bacteriocin/lantibiotic exporter with double-glycine peptidase domain